MGFRLYILCVTSEQVTLVTEVFTFEIFNDAKMNEIVIVILMNTRALFHIKGNLASDTFSPICTLN